MHPAEAELHPAGAACIHLSSGAISVAITTIFIYTCIDRFVYLLYIYIYYCFGGDLGQAWAILGRSWLHLESKIAQDEKKIAPRSPADPAKTGSIFLLPVVGGSAGDLGAILGNLGQAWAILGRSWMDFGIQDRPRSFKITPGSPACPRNYFDVYIYIPLVIYAAVARRLPTAWGPPPAYCYCSFCWS